MKGSNSPVLRVIYIILVPVVLLIILLNSGVLQRYLPAVTIDGTNYTVVQYNFYYYEYYNTFLEEHADELDALGYNAKTDADKQNYDENTTWASFFQTQAEAEMAQTAYYCDLAEEAGYTFSEEELLPVQERLAEQEAQRTLYGLNAKNYYISYFGSGMTLAIYTQELTRVVEARAYKAYLEEQYTPEEADLQAWMAEHPETDYTALELQVITLDAQPDRATDEVGEDQLTALSQKLERLAQRYADGVSFTELQTSFSSDALGDRHGALTATRAAELPAVLTEHYIDAQSDPEADLTQPYSCIDADTGTAYFVLYVGEAGSGPRLDADAALSQQAIQALEDQALSGDYSVNRNTLGMTLAAS